MPIQEMLVFGSAMDDGNGYSRDISGKLVLVTGGGKRIGAEICRILSISGASIIVHAHRSIVESETLVEEIIEAGGEAELVLGDLSNEESRNSLINQILNTELYQSVGGLDLLVNSASIFAKKMPGDDTQEFRKKMLEIHFEAPKHLINAFKETLSSRNGSVVNIIDALLERSESGFEEYCESKKHLANLTLEMAMELAPHVRVNGIGPGAIVASDEEESIVDKIANQVPLKRWGEMEDIASAVLFLSNSPYITGQILNVDGGWSLSRS